MFSADYLLGLSEDDDRSSDIVMRAAILGKIKQLTDMLLNVKVIPIPLSLC